MIYVKGKIETFKELELAIKNFCRQCPSRNTEAIYILVPRWFDYLIREQSVRDYNYRPTPSNEPYVFQGHHLKFGYEVNFIVIYHKDYTLTGTDNMISKHDLSKFI